MMLMVTQYIFYRRSSSWMIRGTDYVSQSMLASLLRLKRLLELGRWWKLTLDAHCQAESSWSGSYEVGSTRGVLTS